jgi:hypothetical protein
MTLGSENISKFDRNCYYKLKADKEKELQSKIKGDVYWCKNWVFQPYISEGEVTMLDTYYNSFGSHHIRINDNNINDFELLVDLRTSTQIHRDDVYMYKEGDVIFAPCDSGGYQSNRCFFLKNGASPVRENLIYRKKQEIERAKRNLESLEYDLKRLQG